MGMLQRMSPTYDPRLSEVLKEFVDEYMSRPPYDEYVTSIGVTDRTLVEWSRHHGARSQAEIRHNLGRGGEDPNEPYLFIGLRKPLPSDMPLPNVYQGFKVHVELTGDTVAS